MKGKIDFIDHPLPECTDEQIPVQLGIPIKFGFLGLATKQKGFFEFLDAARFIGSKHPGKAQFHLIGRIHPDYRNKALPEIEFLETKVGDKPLERDEYIQRLKALHYVCLFYHGTYYDYSASGVLLDCVAWEKPVVATPTRTIKILGEKYGEIGYICNIENVVHVIEMIVQKTDSKSYHNQIEAMRRLKQSRNRSAQATKFKSMLKV